MKDWDYIGDINIEHGGVFFNAKSAALTGYIDAVRVIPATDMGGPDNIWMVESGAITIPYKVEDLLAVLKSTDTRLEVALVCPTALASALLYHFGMECESREIVQRGKPESSGRPIFTPTVQLKAAASLEKWVHNYIRGVM